MAKTFRAWEVDQVWMLPPTVRDLVPAGGPPAARVPAEWPASWIPAFHALAIDRYDAWGFEAASALSSSRAESFERRFFVDEPVRGVDRVLLPAVPWDAVRRALHRLLNSNENSKIQKLIPESFQAHSTQHYSAQYFQKEFYGSNICNYLNDVRHTFNRENES